jgi:hypothetical protein
VQHREGLLNVNLQISKYVAELWLASKNVAPPLIEHQKDEAPEGVLFVMHVGQEHKSYVVHALAVAYILVILGVGLEDVVQFVVATLCRLWEDFAIRSCAVNVFFNFWVKDGTRFSQKLLVEVVVKGLPLLFRFADKLPNVASHEGTFIEPHEHTFFESVSAQMFDTQLVTYRELTINYWGVVQDDEPLFWAVNAIIFFKNLFKFVWRDNSLNFGLLKHFSEVASKRLKRFRLWCFNFRRVHLLHKRGQVDFKLVVKLFEIVLAGPRQIF